MQIHEFRCLFPVDGSAMQAEASGFVGADCHDAFEPVKRALGGIVIEEQARPEAFLGQPDRNPNRAGLGRE